MREPGGSEAARLGTRDVLRESRIRQPAAPRELVEHGVQVFALGHLRRGKGRAALVVAGLALGIATAVAIARAIVNRPPLVLADEPTGNLDSATARSVMEALSALHSAGRTIFLVTHDEEVASWARRTVRMRDGRIVEDAAR